jgi:hypothetical protein
MIPLTEIPLVVYALIPGFLAAWVFYGLTAHPRKDSFERTVQALVFTAIIQAITSIVRWGLTSLGKITIVFGTWTPDVALSWSLIVALVFGFFVAALANNNTVHSFLWSRDWKFRKRPAWPPPSGWISTKRTAFPGEWYSAFNTEGHRYIVLTLKDGNRLYGWPEEWPDQPDSGHFVMTEAEWLPTKEGDGSVRLDKVSRILVAAADVVRVEFVNYPDESSPHSA